MNKPLLSAAIIGVIIAGALIVFFSLRGDSDESASKSASVVQYYATACPSGTSDAGYSIDNIHVCEISNIITNDITLSPDRYWRIRGEVQIGGDNQMKTKLVIKPGSTLFGKSGGDFIVINRGSKIIAEGTASDPIVFTSEKDLKKSNPVSGDWGGLVIAGNAPINKGREETFEFSHRQIRFGGTNPHDDSGVLKYVIIKYAGDEVLPQKELNGLSLGGVGDGTTIDYIEVFKGKDDGIELWGGTVNMKHVLLLGNRDDSLDTDTGYRGMIQYLYAEKFRLEAGQYGNGIEADNSKKHPNAAPISHPVLANFEFVGSAGSAYGILLRRGTGYTLINGIVTGFDKAQLAIHDAATIANGQLGFISVALDGNEESGDLYRGKTGVSAKEIKQRFENSPRCKVDAIKTQASDVRQTTGKAFFDPAPFIGAYDKENDWRLGWSYGF